MCAANSSQCNEDSEYVAGHVLVQQQLQDVILAQQRTIDTLREELDSKRNAVPGDKYEAAVKLFEDERIAHAETKRQLMETQDKLIFAEAEIQILQKQLDQEKEQFVRISSMLRSKALRETRKNVELENKCHEFCQEKEEEHYIIRVQAERISSLSAQLKAKQSSYKQHRLECELQKQQQKYIDEIMKERDKMCQKTETKNKLLN